MKKILLLLCSLGSASLTFAQSTQSTSYGVIGGLNVSTLSSTTSGSTSGSSSLVGFHIGGFVDFSLSESVSIQPGILYSVKGGSDDESETMGSTTIHVTGKSTLNYLEVPVNVYYHIPVSPGSIFLGGGPYFGWGLSGKQKVDVSGSATASVSQNVTYGSNSGDIKNPDYGINLGAGITLKNNLLFKVGYGIGIANLSNDSGSTGHVNVFSVSVGYSFK